MEKNKEKVSKGQSRCFIQKLIEEEKDGREFHAFEERRKTILI